MQRLEPETEIVQPPSALSPAPLGDKLIEKYVLFGSPGTSRTAVYLELVRAGLLAEQPTTGYRADEAMHARNVVIVGEPQDVSLETEDMLRQAGCRVQRVQGTPQQMAAAFADILGN